MQELTRMSEPFFLHERYGPGAVVMRSSVRACAYMHDLGIDVYLCPWNIRVRIKMTEFNGEYMSTSN